MEIGVDIRATRLPSQFPYVGLMTMGAFMRHSADRTTDSVTSRRPICPKCGAPSGLSVFSQTDRRVLVARLNVCAAEVIELEKVAS
jgi:hypothetical protein